MAEGKLATVEWRASSVTPAVPSTPSSTQSSAASAGSGGCVSDGGQRSGNIEGPALMYALEMKKITPKQIKHYRLLKHNFHVWLRTWIQFPGSGALAEIFLDEVLVGLIRVLVWLPLNFEGLLFWFAPADAETNHLSLPPGCWICSAVYSIDLLKTLLPHNKQVCTDA